MTLFSRKHGEDFPQIPLFKLPDGAKILTEPRVLSGSKSMLKELNLRMTRSVSESPSLIPISHVCAAYEIWLR